MDSLSITPPLSPSSGHIENGEDHIQHIEVLQDDDLDRVPCFACCGEVSRRGDLHHPDSYWRSNYLPRLLALQPGPDVTADANYIIQLFSFHWPGHVWTSQGLDKLFLCLRQNISDVQAEVHMYKRGVFSNTDERCDVFNKRLEVNDCLHHLQKRILSNSMSDDQLDKVVGCLHKVLLYIGRLSQLPAHVTQAPASCTGNTTSNGSYHCFHLHLDVYWRALAILHAIESKYTGYRWEGRFTPAGEFDTSTVDQVVQMVMWDLVLLAHQRYVNKVANGNYLDVSMFNCTCVREMWLLLVKLLQWRADHMNSESFWISLHHVIKTLMTPNSDLVTEMEIDSDVFINPPENVRVDDVTSLCLWIIRQLAPLFATKLLGAMQDVASTYVCNYHDVMSLLKLYLAGPSVNEIGLRRHLKTLNELSLLWEPNTAILVNLWDYFYRKLNSTFQLTSASVEGLASVQLSAVAMFDQCKIWTQAQEDGLGQETSYQLFLRLLARHLGQLYAAGSTQEWKQIKGRFYSKFHQRRMQELTEGGLYNFTSLFLTLALTSDLEDVAAKLCDFYDMLDYSRITIAKRAMIWRGAFALMLVYGDRGQDMGFLVDKMVRALDGSVATFKTAGVDTRHSLWKLILVYLDSTQDVLDTSPTLTLSQHRLICPGLKTLLPCCSVSELWKMLCISQNILTRFRQVSEDYDLHTLNSKPPPQHTELADNLWMNIFPFVKDHATTLTPPPQLADVAASFCLLSLKFPHPVSVGQKWNFVSLFQLFGIGDSVNASISCRFLGHLLATSGVMDELGAGLGNVDAAIVKSWFRCVLLAQPQQVTEVTRQVLQLATVRAVFTGAGAEVPTNLDRAPIFFLKAIERCHANLQSWKEKMEFRGQIMDYFIDVPKYVASVLKNLSPQETLNNVYNVAGSLVKYCAPLIFVQSKPDCPLPAVISAMVTPHYILDREKAVSPVFLSAIRDTLHLFIQGLSKLDYAKAPYVQRRLKDIVTIYLPKFTLRTQQVSMTLSTVSSVHPVVSSLAPSFSQQASTEAVKFRHFVIQIVVDNSIAVRNMAPHPGHHIGWSFLLDVIQRTSNADTLTRDVPLLLRPCLEYILLLTETSPSYQPVVTTLQHLMQAQSQNLTAVPLPALTEICQKFLSDYFKFNNEGVLRVLEKVALLAVDLVISVIEKLSGCVKEVETKRGIGVDIRLRQKYCHLLKQLGPRGQQETLDMQT